MALSTSILRTFCRTISTNFGEFIPVSSSLTNVKCLRQYSDTATKKRDEPYTVRNQQDGIRTIFLNDVRKRNALSLAMLESLKSDLLHEVENEDLRVIIITSSGPVFSSGHDLKELTAREGSEYHIKVFNTCSETMQLIRELPVPVIAQVQGIATAAGCQLVASCDIAIATEDSKFATPGVNVGLFCSTPAVAVGRAIPQKVSMEMLFTGEPIDAQAALKHGLISKIVPNDRLEEETMAVAKTICKSSRSVIALGKSCFYHQITKDLSEAYKQAGEVMVFNLNLRDGQEGISAFIEKRKPSWNHGFDHVNEKD